MKESLEKNEIFMAFPEMERCSGLRIVETSLLKLSDYRKNYAIGCKYLTQSQIFTTWLAYVAKNLFNFLINICIIYVQKLYKNIQKLFAVRST